ncbi:MAG: zf-HC2 domain-containing protein [Casimicrobiaceae bacterium]
MTDMALSMLKLSCKEATRLISQSMDQKLTLSQRAAVRVHLSACEACTRFGAHLHNLRAAMRKYRE